MSATSDADAHVVEANKTFSRVLVGVDGTPESFDAVRQAAQLKAPGGVITCLAAWNLAVPVVTPMAVAPSREVEEREARDFAERAVRSAQAFIPSADVMVVHGSAGHALIDAAAYERSTLIAVGSHGQPRTRGILLGSTATLLLHDAPCSVLLARETTHLTPRRIVVGVDGSPESAAAYSVARYLAGRFDGDVSVVVAEGKRTIDPAAVSLIVGDGFHVVPEEPVRVLTAASVSADLLVLGSRGLHGFKSLGSVSERVAHRAACSTLIVRDDDPREG
jgi:nucleotide-binding universal stress UspA family protein